MRRWLFLILSIPLNLAFATMATPKALETFDPDFFRPKGRLEYAEPGHFGCTIVSGPTPLSESAALGRVGQDFCEGGQLLIHYIRKKVGFSFDGYEEEGYYQVCCVKKGEGPSRRPRVP